MSPFPTESMQSDEIDLSGYGLALLRGWRLIAIFGVCAALLSVLSTYFSASPVYEASSTVLVDNKGRKAVGGVILVDSYPLSSESMATEVRRLASYDLLQPAVVSLDLANDPEFGLGINPSMPVEEQYVAAYKNLLDRMEVDTREGTNLIELKVRSKSQAKAIKIADAILERYLSVQAEMFFEIFSELGSETDTLFADPAWLEVELESLQTKVDVLATPGQLSQLETIQQLDNISSSTILLYAYYLSTFNENRYGPEFQLHDAALFSNVLVPPYINNPTESVWSLNAIIFSLFFGLLAGSALILARTAQHGRVCTEDHLALKFGFPVVGTLTSADLETQTNDIAMLRDHLIFSNTAHQRVMVLNAPSKTSNTKLSLPLATRFAAVGKKTLVISAEALAGVKDTFADQELTKGKTLDSAIVSADSFDVLQVAQSADDARDIFPSTAFSAFLNSAQDNYDVVIFAAEDSKSAQIIIPQHRMSTAILLNCDAENTYERDFTAFLRHLPVQSGKISCVFWG